MQRIGNCVSTRLPAYKPKPANRSSRAENNNAGSDLLSHTPAAEHARRPKQHSPCSAWETVYLRGCRRTNQSPRTEARGLKIIMPAATYSPTPRPPSMRGGPNNIAHAAHGKLCICAAAGVQTKAREPKLAG